MTVKSKHIQLQTQGRDHVIDITGFIHGSTASVTTLEYEPALVKDIKNLDEKLIPSGVSYAHDATWGDANGYAHLRASLIGPSMTIPIVNGSMTLGTWQQVIVIDHDNRPRNREVIIQVMGE